MRKVISGYQYQAARTMLMLRGYTHVRTGTRTSSPTRAKVARDHAAIMTIAAIALMGISKRQQSWNNNQSPSSCSSLPPGVYDVGKVN